MIGIILAHGKAQKMFDLHLPNWEAVFDKICVVCPLDDIVEYHSEVHSLGLSEHHGYWNCERMRYACQIASSYADACIVEYDTLIYNLPYTDDTLRGCGPMYDYEPNFVAPWFTHSPWMTTRENFNAISKYEVLEGKHEYCDRWLAEACVVLGIKPSNLESYYTPCCGYIRDANEWKNMVTSAHSKNLSAIHGIKEEFLSKTISAIRKI
jgi:hypothetical protein